MRHTRRSKHQPQQPRNKSASAIPAIHSQWRPPNPALTREEPLASDLAATGGIGFDFQNRDAQTNYADSITAQQYQTEILKELTR